MTVETEQIHEEAAKWLVELETCEILDDLWPSFEDWLRKPEHRAVYMHMENAWHEAVVEVRGLVEKGWQPPAIREQSH